MFGGIIMQINQYSNPIQNSLESYIPLPLDSIFKAGQAIQQRGDLATSQNDQIQTGLASMEALAPAHSQFINNYVNDYKQQQSSLLDKYNGNTSDPDYERESRRVNMQFAADPRLKVIQHTNELIKTKEKIKDELDSKGIKYLDSNPNFTGVDSHGNLSNNVGQLKATNFDEKIDKSFKDLENATKQIKGNLTNRNNLHKHQDTLLADLANGTNPDIQDALHYYKQQGLDDHAAKLAVISHINDGMKYAHDLKDHFYEMSPYQKAELSLRNKELDLKKKEPVAPAVLPFQLLNYSKPLVTGKSVENFEDSSTRGQAYNQVQKVLTGLSSDGNLNSGKRIIDDTPKNRQKFGSNAKPIVQYNAGSGMGYGSSSFPGLEIKDKYDPEEVKLLNTARTMLGIKGGTAKDVLSKYSNLLKSFDTSSQNITSTDNKKLNDVTASVAKRQIASGEVYQNNKGVIEKVKDPSIVSEIDGDNITGISPKNLDATNGKLNGYTQFTDKKGKVYYTPLPQEYQQQFRGSKSIEEYIQDFDNKNIKSVPATIEGKQANIFLNPNDKGQQYIYQGVSGILSPYKATQNGKLVGGGVFTFVNPQTGQSQTALLPLSEIEREEKTSLFSKIVNNNKITGN